MPLNENGLDPDVLRKLYGESMSNPFTDARKLNPEHAAQGLKVSRDTGLDPAWAAANLPQLQVDEDLDRWNRLVDESPKTAKFLSDSPAIAAAAQDDLDNISGIEQAFAALKNTGNAAVSGLRSASSGAVGLARVPFDLGAALVDPLVGTVIPENPLARGAQWLADYQHGIAGRAKAEMPKGDSNLSSGYYSGVGSLARNLASIPMAFLPGGQKAALTTMVAPVGGEAYGQARDEGKGLGSSLSFASSQAAIEYATEKLPLSKLIGDLKEGTPFLKTLLQNAALEIPGEQIATVLQDLNEWAVLNQDKPFSEYIAERPDAATQTLVATLVGTGGQVTVMKGIEKAVGYAEQRGQQAQQAEQDAATIEGLNQLAAASKLLQRDADSFEQFVSAAAEDGPVDTVYIDGKVLMQSGMAPKLAELSPSVRDQIERAAISGGDVAIPVSEYAARIAPTDLAPQLLDHIRTEPEGFTRAEAQTWMEESATELQAEIERGITEGQSRDEFRASQDRVKQAVLDNLNQVGRFSPQKNELDATLIAARSAVRAQQLGMTPEDFFAQQVLRVQGEKVGGMQFDQSGKLVTDTPAFKNWFGDSKVVDAEGKPLVVYHGTPSATFEEFKPESFFTPDPAIAQIYTSPTASSIATEAKDADARAVYPVYLDIKKPFDTRIPEVRKLFYDRYFMKYGMGTDLQESGLPDWNDARDLAEWIQEEGLPFDGLIVDEGGLPQDDGSVLSRGVSYVPFRPEQIKSAIGNRGTFDPNDPNILNQSAYHGSPYKFDKFSLEHMGKGEGAQAYGWGLYFAGNKEVAEFYRKSTSRVEYTGEPSPLAEELTDMLDFAASSKEIDAALAQVRRIMGEQGRKDAVQWLDENSQHFSKPGQLYEVNIPEDDTYLLWDKPLSEQPEKVRKVLGYKPKEVTLTEGEPFGILKEPRWNASNGWTIIKSGAKFDVYNESEGFQGAKKTLEEAQAHIEKLSGDNTGGTGKTLYEDMADAMSGKYVVAESRTVKRVAVDSGDSPTQRFVPDPRLGVYDSLNAAKAGIMRQLDPNLANVDDAFAATHFDKQARNGGAFKVMKIAADGGARAASEHLNRLGISGIKYLDGNSRADGEGSYNYVIFDDEAVQILQTYYQPDGGGPRGTFSPVANIISLLNADLTTFLHETGHYFFENDIALAAGLVNNPNPTAGEQRILSDVQALLTWHGLKGDLAEQLRQWYTMDFEERRVYHERTAESFERYLLEGRAPSIELQSAFQTFRAWMLSVYRSLKSFLERNPEAGTLNDEVRGVFDRMLATEEQIALAEQGRSMMALFTEPMGMTPDEFAAHQAEGKKATETAVDELQAKGLRDMQWLGNKRGREIAKLQREAKALRAEAMIEARREVMSQPVYLAWDFLTGKAKEKTEAQSEHELEVADWKQRRDEAMESARTKAKAEAWDNSEESKQEYENGRAKGMAKGQFLARQKKDIDLIVARAALDWDRSHPKPEAPAKDSAGFDLGEQVYGKLNKAALDDMGIPPEITAHVKKLRMTAADGMHPDMAAEMLGFSSGDELVRTLAIAVPPKEAIAQLTDKLMLERHGELATPEAIATAADMAIHNEVRARFITTEANALAKAIGKPRLLAQAAKAYAAEQIARLKVRDIKPGLYTNAETKAARAAEKAFKAGDTALAAAEKRNQAISVYLARAAYEAKDEVASGLRYLKKFDKRSKTIDPEYQDQIEAMLERFDLKPVSNKALDRRASFAEWLASQRAQGIEPDVPPELENEANRKSYKDMAVEEFRGLIDTVKQIEHLGRMKNKLLTAKDKREFAAIVDEVSASIIENGGKERPVELEQPGRFKEFVENFRAGHRKLASLIRQMDGGKDGGPFWRVFVRGMNEAATNEASMVEDATVRLAEIYKPMLALPGALNGDKRFISEINASLTRAGRLSVALNWGNETNRLRVMEGDGWNEYQVQAILNTLSREEWRFVQNVWEFIDSYWPQIEAKEKRVTGRAPDKVQALPFTVMVNGENVSLSGGYYPIKYDANRDDRAEKHEAAEIADEMKRGAFTRATTRRGHTKARTDSVNRPVKKTLDVITQHVTEVAHDLAWHEWLIDANRLLDAKPVNQAIRAHYGTAVIRTMKDALTGIATGDLARQTAMDTALLYLRANVSRSTMGFSLTTAFLQPFGLLQSVVRIGRKPVLHGIGRWAGDIARMESTMSWVGEKSEFMRLRSKTFNRELHEIKNRVSHGHSKIRTVYDASLFMFMQKMQMVADIPTWIGAYDKALAEGVEEAEAIALADQAVLDAQGGGQTKDMAEIQRKHPMLTMFYSYFNTTLNLAAESTAQTDFKNPMAVAGWLSDMMLLMVVPALGPAMILAMLRGDACWEEDDCARELAQAELGYLLGTVVGVRELSGMTQGYDYAGPPVGRVVADLGKFGTQVSQGEADEAAAMSAVRLFGTALGIPTVQIVRSWRGWQAWDEGDAPPTSILVGPPPKD